MKKTWMLVVALVAGLTILTTLVSSAEENKAGAAPTIKAETTVVGLVAVTKDGDKIKQVTVGQGDAAVCVCTSTEAGKKVAELAGKQVKVTGTVEEKAGKKVITASKVEEVKEEAK